MRNFNISVVMATYNGEKYIKSQIDSILNQLEINDELVISDDGSTDHTIDIIKAFDDKRIKIYEGPHNGVKQNFSNAISKCSGKYIFLSDQDDIWMDNKLNIVLNTFINNNCMCVVHDCIVFNSDTGAIVYDSFYKLRNSKSGIFKNILKNSYIGCCMAFDSRLKDIIIPIPENIEMHDQWIGILSEKNGKSVFIEDKLIKYRRHNNNVSKLKHHGIGKMLVNRITFIKELKKVSD